VVRLDGSVVVLSVPASTGLRDNRPVALPALVATQAIPLFPRASVLHSRGYRDTLNRCAEYNRGIIYTTCVPFASIQNRKNGEDFLAESNQLAYSELG
jgi:hypothetical protein